MKGHLKGAHYLIFEPGMGYFFHATFFQTSFVHWLFRFALNLQTFSALWALRPRLMQWLAPKGITTLDLEPEFFSGVRTSALNDHASRRPSCLLESIERLYQSSFIFYTGPQSHYTQRKKNWVQWHRNGFESRPARVNLKEDMDEETSAEAKERQRKALQSIAKKFRRGVREHRTRGKIKERAGTLPLALSMFRRNASAHGEVDLLKEVQGSEGQTTVHDAAEE